MAAADMSLPITSVNSAPSSSSSSSSSALVSRESQAFNTGLTNLVSAMRHTQDANFHKVMMNIQLLVFALCWFGMVCISISICSPSLKSHNLQGELDFPKDDKTFLDIIARCVDLYKEKSTIIINHILFHRKSRQYNVLVSDVALEDLKAASLSCVHNTPPHILKESLQRLRRSHVQGSGGSEMRAVKGQR